MDGGKERRGGEVRTENLKRVGGGERRRKSIQGGVFGKGQASKQATKQGEQQLWVQWRLFFPALIIYPRY